MTLAKFMIPNLLMISIACIPLSSSLYNSAHISTRAATGILWSSGNKAMSLKHSMIVGLSSKTSKIFWRRVSNSVLESRIERPCDSSFTILCHKLSGRLLSDVAMTLTVSGKPWQLLTTCNSLQANLVRNQIIIT